MTDEKTTNGAASALSAGLEAIAFVLFLETWLDENETLTDLGDEVLQILGKKWREEWLPERYYEHYGDCTKVSGACIRCVLDGLYANAARILAAFETGWMGGFAFTRQNSCVECHEVADENCDICGGEIDYIEKITVPLDTCKEIYKVMAIAERKANRARR